MNKKKKCASDEQLVASLNYLFEYIGKILEAIADIGNTKVFTTKKKGKK